MIEDHRVTVDTDGSLPSSDSGLSSARLARDIPPELAALHHELQGLSDLVFPACRRRWVKSVIVAMLAARGAQRSYTRMVGS